MSHESTQTWIAKALIVAEQNVYSEIMAMATGTVKKLKQNKEIIEHCARRRAQLEMELERLSSPRISLRSET